MSNDPDRIYSFINGNDYAGELQHQPKYHYPV
jgi:hypothetical protein